MKKFFFALLFVVATAVVFFSCNKGQNPQKDEPSTSEFEDLVLTNYLANNTNESCSHRIVVVTKKDGLEVARDTLKSWSSSKADSTDVDLADVLSFYPELVVDSFTRYTKTIIMKKGYLYVVHWNLVCGDAPIERIDELYVIDGYKYETSSLTKVGNHLGVSFFDPDSITFPQFIELSASKNKVDSFEVY